MAHPEFVPGAELSAAFYAEVVRPLLADRPHSAAFLGWGSDVLGYDTVRSTDHGWGPRLQVFIDDETAVPELDELLDARLPDTFRSWPVRYGWDRCTPRHHVEVATLPRWLERQLGVDATKPLSLRDWLLTPQQRLLGVVSGAVHADNSGRLRRVRHVLGFYPDEVWRWLLACQWHRIAQEEAFVSRTAEVGDELGSAVVAGRQAREIMRCAMLLARRYAPYEKWLGTAFSRLACEDGLPAALHGAVSARDGDARQQALADAYFLLARRHNAAGVTAALDPQTRTYHSRPARVLMADRFAAECHSSVTDPWLTQLPLIGGIDQVVDNTDVLCTPGRWRACAALYAGDTEAAGT